MKLIDANNAIKIGLEGNAINIINWYNNIVNTITSIPWSKRHPKGVESCIFLACFPSNASKVLYQTMLHLTLLLSQDFA